MKPIYKTTLEVWSTKGPYTDETGGILNWLAEENSKGTAYVTRERTVKVPNPRNNADFQSLKNTCAISEWLRQFDGVEE